MVFYGVGENKFKQKILFEKQYMTEFMTNQEEPFPVTALAFDKDGQILVFGDEFGNVECWDISEVLELLQLCRVEKSSFSKRRESKKENNVATLLKNILVEETILLTEVRKVEDISFSKDLVNIHLKMKQAHSDGITYISTVRENDAFITASFDCCCHIWSINDGRKLGSLLLGGDPNWKVKFDLEHRKR